MSNKKLDAFFKKMVKKEESSSKGSTLCQEKNGTRWSKEQTWLKISALLAEQKKLILFLFAKAALVTAVAGSIHWYEIDTLKLDKEVQTTTEVATLNLKTAPEKVEEPKRKNSELKVIKSTGEAKLKDHAYHNRIKMESVEKTVFPASPIQPIYNSTLLQSDQYQFKDLNRSPVAFVVSTTGQQFKVGTEIKLFQKSLGNKGKEYLLIIGMSADLMGQGSFHGHLNDWYSTHAVTNSSPSAFHHKPQFSTSRELEPAHNPEGFGREAHYALFLGPQVKIQKHNSQGEPHWESGINYMIPVWNSSSSPVPARDSNFGDSLIRLHHYRNINQRIKIGPEVIMSTDLKVIIPGIGLSFS